MALEIKGNLMVFSIPNSEAIIDVQRKTEKERTVGSYYLSNLADEATIFLNNLNGYFYVDLNASYLYCLDFYTRLIENCRSLYRNDLYFLESALKDIRWSAEKNPDSQFFKTFPPTIIESRKYLKFPDQGTQMGLFRSLCIGDITEIIIEKLSPTTFRVFVRPKKDALGAVNSIKALELWLKKQGKIK